MNPKVRTLFEVVVMGAVLALVLLLLIQAAQSVRDRRDEVPPEDGEEINPLDVWQRAEDATNSAEDTANELQLLLSFLEGAAVLVGLALGAAAYVGLRNSNETRAELKQEIQELEELRERFQKEISEQLKVVTIQTSYLQSFKGSLEYLPQQLEKNEQLQQNYSDLLIASQELRLNNHLEAYAAAKRVLDREEDNAPALYIAGWLELQYVSGKRPDGIKKLERVAQVQRDWPTARAAYGVGLRRQARDTKDETERKNLFRHAEGELLGALGQSPHLLDLNLESFWGPVGGIRREMENIPGAIEAYQEALKVTPTSSYPQGNLAALLLKQAQYDDALAAFEKTLQYATVELAVNPGDYYHVMDVAMARMMLSQFDPAFTMLDSALNMYVTREPLNTSLHAGWEFLYENCPDDWTEIKQNIEIAIEQVKRAIEAR